MIETDSPAKIRAATDSPADDWTSIIGFGLVTIGRSGAMVHKRGAEFHLLRQTVADLRDDARPIRIDPYAAAVSGFFAPLA
jgi:hypothetical protein